MTCGEFEELSDKEQEKAAQHFLDQADLQDEEGLAEEVADEMDGDCGDDDDDKVADAAEEVVEYLELLGG